jgi:hypothetical protein
MDVHICFTYVVLSTINRYEEISIYRAGLYTYLVFTLKTLLMKEIIYQIKTGNAK